MVQPTRFTGSPSNLPRTSVTRSKTEFDTKDMDFFMETRGIKVKWERAWLCTCRNPMTQAPRPNCPRCHGRGIAYLPASEETVAIQSQERGLVNGDLGLYDSGTAIGSTRLESVITFRDRLTVPDVEIYQSLIFDVTDRRVKNGMYMSYDVKRLELVMGENGAELALDEDYTFDEVNNMFHPKAHLIGTNISINMAVTLRYIVIDLLKESRYQYTHFGVEKPKFENLPRKLLLKREDIFVDSEPFSLAVDTKSRLEALEETTQPEVSTKEPDVKMVDPKRGASVSGFFGGKLNG